MQPYQAYPVQATPQIVAHVSEQERTAFMRKVYLHVAGALVLFLVLQGILQSLPFAETMVDRLSNFWLIVILGMSALGWIASRWTLPGLPLSQQYLGLALYTLGQAIIFMPMIAYIRFYQDDSILVTGSLLTLALVVGLSMIALDPRTNFSFLRGALFIGFPVSFAIVIGGILLGWNLGMWFSIAMIGLAAGSILYQTDAIVKQSRTDGYVSAALGLFASIMLLLFYVLRLLAGRR
ncbi:MAG TPA: Bax inhibitor-1 family protein [Thermomicrobiales bacterium]|nr:Bax inhibitor-1 family protein [Thermomicrobiales bacterium]HRA46559.1 Bax inhibitor-1 family protein [Thermomicrobiales bacterium]